MKRIVTAIAAAALITGVPAAARAAPAHHHQAAAHPQVQILWYSQANNDDLWWPNHNYFTVNQTGGTALTPAGCNNGNYCEEMLPNGNCMTWDSGPNNVEELNCQGLDRQMWNFEYVGSATYIPSNLYANSAMPCTGTPRHSGSTAPGTTLTCRARTPADTSTTSTSSGLTADQAGKTGAPDIPVRGFLLH